SRRIIRSRHATCSTGQFFILSAFNTWPLISGLLGRANAAPPRTRPRRDTPVAPRTGLDAARTCASLPLALADAGPAARGNSPLILAAAGCAGGRFHTLRDCPRRANSPAPAPAGKQDTCPGP